MYYTCDKGSVLFNSSGDICVSLSFKEENDTNIIQFFYVLARGQNPLICFLTESFGENSPMNLSLTKEYKKNYFQNYLFLDQK